MQKFLLFSFFALLFTASFARMGDSPKDKSVFEKLSDWSKRKEIEEFYSIEAADIRFVDIQGVSTNVIVKSAPLKNKLEFTLRGSISYKNENKKELPLLNKSKRGSRLTLSIDETDRGKTFGLINLQSNLNLVIELPASWRRSLTIETVSGNVTLGDLKLNQLKVETTSGDIMAKTINTEGVFMRSISGNMAFQRLTGRASIESTSGDVNFVLNEMNHDIKIDSVSGDITMRLEKNIEFELKSSTVSGRIANTLPLQTSLSGRRNMFGQKGDGGKTIDIETVSGDISLDTL